MTQLSTEHTLQQLYSAECDETKRLRALNAELARLCEKALTRSAIVHPGFADEIRAALAKAQS